MHKALILQEVLGSRIVVRINADLAQKMQNFAGEVRQILAGTTGYREVATRWVRGTFTSRSFS